ncbi:MAG: hypothetical protein ACRDGN_15400 [bacterium]
MDVRIEPPARRPVDRLLRPADAVVLVIVAQIVIHASWAILGWRDTSRLVVLELVWTFAALNGLTAIGKLARHYHVTVEAVAANIEPRVSSMFSVPAQRCGLSETIIATCRDRRPAPPPRSKKEGGDHDHLGRHRRTRWRYSA